MGKCLLDSLSVLQATTVKVLNGTYTSIPLNVMHTLIARQDKDILISVPEMIVLTTQLVDVTSSRAFTFATEVRLTKAFEKMFENLFLIIII